MCGITGEVRFDGAPVAPWDAQRACDLMAHRGPDERGSHESAGAVLAMCRLSVIGRDGGSQPAYNASGTVACVFNGEIYNHRELRRRLERAGLPVLGTSDAHVIPPLYDLLGEDFVHELRGMFAIALYDGRRGELLLVTDRTGKKPLVYTRRADGSVVFASELAALAAYPGIDRTLDPVAIDQYLGYRVVPAPRTVYENVRKVPPATLLAFRAGGAPAERRYWHFPFDGSRAGLPREQLVGDLRGLLEAAVAERLESEVPLGAMLSGGLDSSLVVAVASRLLGRRMHTFSVGFEQAAFDESSHAADVSAYFGTEHHAHRITPEDAELAIDPILRHVGEPYAFPSAIASWYMYRLAAEHVTVVLTGDGSDEIFAGYNRYKVFSRFPDVLAADAHRVDLDLLATAGDDVARRYQSVLVDGLRDGLKARLYAGALREAFPADHLSERFAATPAGNHPLHRVMQVDCGFWLPDAQLVKIDRMAMAHSVEPRSPLLDHRLVEYVCGVDASHKLDGDDEKALLKAVAAGYVPEPTIRRRKQELAVPLEDWLGRELRGRIQATLLSEASLSRGHFRPDALRALVRDFRREDSYALWTLFMLERWQQLFVDGRQDALDHVPAGVA